MLVAPVGWEVGREWGEEEEEVGGREERRCARGVGAGGVEREELGRPDLSLNAAISPVSAIKV